MQEFSPFKLSRTIAVHSNDVRSVVLFNDGSAVTTSRDGKAILSSASGATSTLLEGSSFLNSATVNSSNTKVYIGSHDSSITECDLELGTQLYFLGHTGNVSCLDCFGTQSLLASGSWDHIIRIWQSPESSYELKAHTQNVWDVKFVDEHRLLSASADKTIKLWDLTTKSVTKTYTGHTDVVRALALVSDSQFVSASNDGTLRIWDLHTGETTAVLHGHTSFVYSLATIGDYVVSSSEDRTVRIWDWRHQRSVQTIVLPSISQWCVASNAKGDFVVGSSDNTARVFTQASDRQASAEDLAAFAEAVKQSAFGENEIDESQVADPSTLQQPGKQEGQVVMVRNADTKSLEAHQYSSGTWTKIGDVVGQNQSSGSKKETYDGKQYDYVFDVDIKEGAPPLKLPFNNSDNPYTVAENFIALHQLPPSYVEQIVQFLIQNSQAKKFDVSASAYTGAGSQAPAVSPPTDVPAVLRYSQLLTLKVFQPALLNALQKTADERGDNLIPYNIESLLNSLPSSGSDLLKVALELKSKWRDSLPALLPVFDLLRIAIPDAASIQYNAVWINLLDALDAALPKHCMLAIRGVANLVGRSDYETRNPVNKTMANQAISMIEAAVPNLPVSKPLAVALSTLVLNLAVQHVSEPGLGRLIQIIQQNVIKSNDPEAIYRLLLAVGLHSVAAPGEAHMLRRSWFSDIPKEERITDLLEVVSPRIS